MTWFGNKIFSGVISYDVILKSGGPYPIGQVSSEKGEIWDFSSGPMAGNPPANARDVGLIPSVGGFHMQEGQLNPCATTTESCRNYWAHTP